MKCPDCGKPMEIVAGVEICTECEDMNKTLDDSDWYQEDEVS